MIEAAIANEDRSGVSDLTKQTSESSHMLASVRLFVIVENFGRGGLTESFSPQRPFIEIIGCEGLDKERRKSILNQVFQFGQARASSFRVLARSMTKFSPVPHKESDHDGKTVVKFANVE